MVNAGRNHDYLEERLAAGSFTMGEVRVDPSFEISHVEDRGRGDLRIYQNPHEAITIARYDDEGRYRPLKTAPNLAHGWLLRLANLKDVLLALDFLYPAELGAAVWHLAGDLRPVSLRQTLGRQSGMYAVTRKLSDSQAEDLVRNFCGAGCLRRILWPIDGDAPRNQETEPSGAVPLLCAEACNLFVAEARNVVKPAVK